MSDCQDKVGRMRVLLCPAVSMSLVLACSLLPAQKAPELPLSDLPGRPREPVYTVYAAPMERSQYMVDEGYQLIYDRPDQPLSWVTDTAGKIDFTWGRDGRVIHNVADYLRPPSISQSYSDGGRLHFSPIEGIRVVHSFAVYSSSLLILEFQMLNESNSRQTLRLAVSFQRPEGIQNPDIPGTRDHLFFHHSEPPDRWSETKIKGFPPYLENVLLSRPEFGRLELLFPEAEKVVGNPGKKDQKRRSQPQVIGARGYYEFSIPAGRERVLRLVRGVDRTGPIQLWLRSEKLVTDLDFEQIFAEAAARYDHVPRLEFGDADKELVYWQSFSLIRQMMMPAEGKAGFNYYLFAREPTWGWGHDGQVFHESLAMIPYAHMDPRSAMDSQRVFMERQEPNGYIYYRLGPYVARDFPVKKSKTSSAPLFNWINWEIFRVARDRDFLEQSYSAGSRYLEYLLANRDQDKDGLYEWGGNAVLECVRDGFNVVWNLLGEKPESPRSVEALDLNCMLVKEMKSLASMAEELEKSEEGRQWRSQAEALAGRINETMWDEKSGFYYHVDRSTHQFVTSGGADLRRMEMIGFLPLWAGIVPEERKPVLLEHLLNPKKFWRKFGVPSLSADDPYFDPRVDRCCKWNGAVWPQWNFLIFRGLLENGFRQQAARLAERNYLAATTQLRANHLFWESYSPDEEELATYAPYVWAGILAQMSIDLDKNGEEE